MLLAQSLGEYGGAGSIITQVASSVESGAQWVQLSLRDNPGAWIGAAVCIVVVVWLFRRR